MYEPILLWIGWAVILLLCLPFASTRKLILDVCGIVLRLALLAVLAGGVLLWLQPDRLPSQVSRFVDDYPAFWDSLPPPGTQAFGLAVAIFVAGICLPLLAILDTARQWMHVTQPVPVPVATEPEQPIPATVTPIPAAAAPAKPAVAHKRPDRRAAADTMAKVGSSKPFRVADHVG